MKIFKAILLAGLFATAAAQCADLDFKILKAVDSSREDKDYIKFTGTVQVPGDLSV